MLVLTRKDGESVRIADDVEIVVLECKHGKVRLGFRCPDDKTILRTEVWERQQEELASMGVSAAAHCVAG